jgi:O-acetylhomoserine (thiol)-lyase
MSDLKYPDALIARVLRAVKTIALVGASAKPDRPAHVVMAAMQARGFRVIPVNPGVAGQTLLGETVRARLSDMAEPIDMVQVFRRAEAAPAIVADAMRIGAKVIWMQLGVRHDAAAATAQAAGLTVIMDRCPIIEFERLGDAFDKAEAPAGES